MLGSLESLEKGGSGFFSLNPKSSDLIMCSYLVLCGHAFHSAMWRSEDSSVRLVLFNFYVGSGAQVARPARQVLFFIEHLFM